MRRDPVKLLPRHHGRGLDSPGAAEEAQERGGGRVRATAPHFAPDGAAGHGARDGREHAAEPDRRGGDLRPSAHRGLLVEGAHEKAEEERRGAQGVCFDWLRVE